MPDCQAPVVPAPPEAKAGGPGPPGGPPRGPRPLGGGERPGTGGPDGPFEAGSQSAGAPAGGGVSPGLRGPQLPGDRGRVRKDGDLGPGDLLPEQGKTQEWRRE